MRIAPIALVLAAVLSEAVVYFVVGSAIGILPTLGLGLLSMVAGTVLLRRQGMATMSRMRAEARAGRMPAAALVEGAVIAFAALLMILPGFITDVVGILLFVPPLRRWLGSRIRLRLELQTSRPNGLRQASPSVVDLDRSQYAVETRPESPWRRDGLER